MANEHMIAQVRSGMVVHTADVHPLGKVTQVRIGTDPTASRPRCDDERCSRIEVQRGRLLTRQMRYVPISAICGDAADQVTFNVEAPAVDEHDWLRIPPWIAAIISAAEQQHAVCSPFIPITLATGGTGPCPSILTTM